MPRLTTAVASGQDPEYKKMLEDIDAFEKKTKHITDLGPKCFVCEKGVPIGKIINFSNRKQFMNHMNNHHKNYFEDIRKTARHGAKEDSSRMSIDDPSTSSIGTDAVPSTSAIGTDPVPSTSSIEMEEDPSTSAIEMEEEPSTSEHLMEIDDKDREAYRISELHEYDYYEQMERYQAEERNQEEEEEIASDFDDDNIEIPFMFLNEKNLEEFEAEIIPYKSKHEPIFLKNLFQTKYKENYQQFLLDVNCWRYEENMNMQTINKIVPSTINHCISVLPNIETNEECMEVYDNMKTLSNSAYYLNQFLELLPTYVPPEHERWESKTEFKSQLRFSWVKPSKICERIFLNNKYIISQLVNETVCKQTNKFDKLKYFEHLNFSIERRNEMMGKLQLEFGFDDFSITNPIGVKNVNHMYMALYLSSPTIPLQYRLKKNDIFVLMLINRLEMKRAGYELNDVLKPLIEDLKNIMKNGIVKEYIDDTDQRKKMVFKICVSAVCGDNKGIYELLGFHTSFTRNTFICRICGAKAIKKELRQCRNPIDFQGDFYQNALIKDMAKTKTTDKDYGLKAECIFAGLPNLTISNIAPLDCMHDFDEGICENIIFAIIKLNKIEVNNIERAIKKIQYHEDRVKITGSHRGNLSTFKIRGTAASKFEFFCRFDEILINLKVSLVPDAYKLYTNAKEFAQLCHSFELNAGDIQRLKTCAEIIVDLYSSVPDLNITPKFHNILHYWQDAEKFGSIYRNSSYKYERVHQSNKRSIASSKNTINPSLSMINYSQRKRAIHLFKENFFEIDFYENLQ
ncbi:uncharacterized protein LOC113794835 [Dermatophagoides pteronyssinus]|uniref:uncharacterized protein LOC113794835 n=1 Tax=Dermatophagoides pteronyssinus TaxID=6956 RepID=UPI003F6645EC